MSVDSDRRSQEFLKISAQFKLGALTTEASHPVTANLSETARRDTAEGLRLLFEADADVLRKYEELASGGLMPGIARIVAEAVASGGRVFCTGCGSTGRLSIQLVSIWRDFWHRQASQSPDRKRWAEDLEQRFHSVMAGGDFALIKSVEGFEDFTAFGKQQLAELGVGKGDVVFAITEGGETSFVIGTAWKGLEAGAKVYFVYNNPDDVLRQHVQRSREVLDEPRIEKVNLTTGPMSITGSTRMQATSIQLAVMLTIIEGTIRQLLGSAGVPPPGPELNALPATILAELRELHAGLQHLSFRTQLAGLVDLEAGVYRSRGKNNYFGDQFAIDLLTDTTERSPTYCTPAFRKAGETQASESWAFLFVNRSSTDEAWRWLLKRTPRCIAWSADQISELVGPDQAARTAEIVKKISCQELMRFRIGLDGLEHRKLGPHDCAVAVIGASERNLWLDPQGFFRVQLEAASACGARTGLLLVGPDPHAFQPVSIGTVPPPAVAYLRVPPSQSLLETPTRVGLKLVLNALSTCTMVKLGRVMGNFMIWVVPSNLKLIDRATRYIQKLTGLDYPEANRLLFDVIEYVEPRMKSDRAYPPVVGVAVLRAKERLGNEQAEQRLANGNSVA